MNSDENEVFIVYNVFRKGLSNLIKKVLKFVTCFLF